MVSPGTTSSKALEGLYRTAVASKSHRLKLEGSRERPFRTALPLRAATGLATLKEGQVTLELGDLFRAGPAPHFTEQRLLPLHRLLELRVAAQKGADVPPALYFPTIVDRAPGADDQRIMVYTLRQEGK